MKFRNERLSISGTMSARDEGRRGEGLTVAPIRVGMSSSSAVAVEEVGEGAGGATSNPVSTCPLRLN